MPERSTCARRHWPSLAVGLAALGLTGPCAGAAAPRPEIWLAPFAPLSRPGDPRSGAPDYFNLFDPGAPWDGTAAQVHVFELYRDQELLMSDEQLRAVIRGLADRHIALGLETNVLQATSTCAPGVGKAAPITAEIERLKRLGADLRYLAMNEPLMGGHGVTGPGDCHASIAAVAADVAATLKPLLALYPGLQIGDVEPVGRADPASHPADMQDWPGQIGAWMTAYRAAMGRPLAFIHADTVWERDWKGDLQQLAQVSRAAGVPFGVLYRGDMSEMSDAALAADTARYAAQVEDGLGLRPDHVVFQSWWNWPRHDLPDTDLTTMTGMIRDYLRSRTTLVLAGGRLRLTGAQGDAIGHAALTVDVHDPAPGATLTPQRIAGTVPPGADAALFALRVHADCLCAPAPARIELAGFQYGEQGAQGGYEQARFAWDLHDWFSAMPGATRALPVGGVPALQINAAAGQKLVLNGPRFPVRAGAPFEARFAWQVGRSSEDAGYAALIFFGPNGVEIKRTLLRFAPSWRPAGGLTTDAAGYAAMPPAGVRGQTVSVAFGGDGTHRPTRTILP